MISENKDQLIDIYDIWYESFVEKLEEFNVVISFRTSKVFLLRIKLFWIIKKSA